MYKLKEFKQFHITFGKSTIFIFRHRSTMCVCDGDVIDPFLKPETSFFSKVCNER